MSRLFKILTLIITMGTVFLTLYPALLGQAAPPALPACGHSAVFSFNSATSFAGPPDIAVSNDAAQTNTAIAWSGGQLATNNAGQVRLAYSDVMTTSRSWSTLTVDSATASGERGLNPSIVFDPTSNNLVHVAYRKNFGIYYKRCNLTTGTCPVAKDLTYTTRGDGLTAVDQSPQIAVINSTVVIVYQRDESPSSGKKYLNYAYILSSGTGTPVVDKELTDNAKSGVSAVAESNPTVASANNKVHIAYAAEGLADEIQYLSLVSGDLGSTGQGVEKQFGIQNGRTAPAFPALAARGTELALVWQVSVSASGPYNLVYNTSSDNGTTWSSANRYRYTFTKNDSSATGAAVWQTDPENSQFTGGLKPDVSIDAAGDLHVVWQAQTPSRHDILYSRLPTAGDWEHGTTAAAFTDTATISYTNVTTVYRTSEYSVTGQSLAKVEPVVVFGEPGNRLQIAYMSQTSAGGWDVFYNGWQLEKESTAYDFDDTDCDWLSDASEIPPGVSPPQPTLDDHDNDLIPNFMDEDSDGDGASDFLEFINGTDPYDSTIEPPDTTGGGVFLPVILKNS